MPNGSNHSSAGTSAALFRIDKFIVPTDALPTFMEQLHRIQRSLDGMPGCQQNLVLSRTAGSGEFNVITVVEWANDRALATAKAAMQEKYTEEGFDPAAFMQGLGVRADLGVYRIA